MAGSICFVDYTLHCVYVYPGKVYCYAFYVYTISYMACTVFAGGIHLSKAYSIHGT